MAYFISIEKRGAVISALVEGFTRLTNAFSKKLENHMRMIALFHMHHYFVRVHQTLRVTPAMEAGLSSHVWSIQEIMSLFSGFLARVA